MQVSLHIVEEEHKKWTKINKEKDLTNSQRFRQMQREDLENHLKENGL